MAGAASYSSSLIHETEADNQEVLTLIWRSGLKSWKKRLIRLKVKLRNGAYPAHLESLWVIMAVVMALHFLKYKGPHESINMLVAKLPKYKKIFFCLHQVQGR